tara:strand:- start:320 stop:664 length:345 start_codon:yes stop_codon:yes gene_type:complete
MSKSIKAVTPKVPAAADVPTISAGKAENAVCPSSIAGVLYTNRNGFPYNPRVSHTQEAWQKVQSTMGIKGEATHKQLCSALALHFTRTGENHHDFIGYMVRRKAISVVIKPVDH